MTKSNRRAQRHRVAATPQRAILIRIIRGPRDVPDQMKMVSAGTAAVARPVDERADNVDAEPANRALFSRCIQIGRANSERIEWRRIVDKTYVKVVPSPHERHPDGSSSRLRSIAMRHYIGEELFENDQNPRPLVVRQTVLAYELGGKSL